MLPIVELVRLEENFDFGTFGVLKINKEVFCFTLEPRDEENKKNISSIPVQQYVCEKITSEKFGQTFEIKNVPDRLGVLFHKGNTVSDTQGCIILGNSIGIANNKRVLLDSGDAFINFMNTMSVFNKFHLTVMENF